VKPFQTLLVWRVVRRVVNSPFDLLDQCGFQTLLVWRVVRRMAYFEVFVSR